MSDKQPTHLYWGWQKPHQSINRTVSPAEDLASVSTALTVCGASVLVRSGRILLDPAKVTCAACKKQKDDSMPGIPEELRMTNEERKAARDEAAEKARASASATKTTGASAGASAKAAPAAAAKSKKSGLEAAGVEGRKVGASSGGDKKSGPPKREVGKDQFDVAQVAAHLKMEPRLVRAALRKSDMTKPADGWVWSKKDWDKVIAIVSPPKK